MRFAQRLFLALFLCLFTVSAVTAIGLSPPNALVEYEPGKELVLYVAVFNYNDFPVGLETRTTGALASATSVQLPASIPARSSAQIPIHIRLPAVRERPGHQYSYVFFKEKFAEASTGTFAVRTEVGLTIDVWQPFPGNYAEITASAQSVSAGEDTVLKVFINNLGVEPVSGGQATIRVVPGSGGEAKDTFTFNGINVPGNSNANYAEVIPSSGYEPGKYILEAILYYANNFTRTNGSFVVGVQDVEASGVQGSFYRDQPVNRFEIPIESLWNLPLDNVYAVFSLGERSTQTAAVTLPAFAQSSLSGYWETDAALAPGEHVSTVRLYFPGGQKNYTFPVTLHNETPQPPSAPQEEAPLVTLGGLDVLFLVLVILIVGCLVLYSLQKHRKAPPQEPVQPPAEGPPTQP